MMEKQKFISEKDIKYLEGIMEKERISQGISNRELHSHDESFHSPCLPEVVLWPHSTDEVSRIVRYAFENNIPITPWGAGTSLEGNPIPVKGGIVLDFQEMNKTLAIRQEDFQVDVQPGVIYKELNKDLGRLGLFFPPDPGAAATIGGMIANNASGIRTVKYGATKDCVMRLVVVMPNGDVLKIGNRARKSSSGYDLVHLFIGSEGTLGVVTEATLKLVGLPVNFMAVRATFPTIKDATATVFQIMSSGLTPSAMEFLDSEVVKVINQDRELALEEKPTLLMEFDGYSERGLEEEMNFAEDICRENNCLFLDKGLGLEERNRLWEIRHLVVESIKRNHPGLEMLIMDVAVPLSRYSDMVLFIKDRVRDFHAYVFGHAGDGNIHVAIMDDPQDEKRWDSVEMVNRLIVKKALEFEGTCTGEHGVGIGKREFMDMEHGNSLEIMRKLKSQLIDPSGIMNPGKMFF
ncbi:MAG: FAD-binding oxidoreductase [Syntrophales bacterium]|nr:FAD-binding oxidoreductase [Syntrophales bacterium]